MTQEAPAKKRQERTEQFKLKDVEMRFNADGDETYSVSAHPRFRNGWSNYPKEMFLWGENPKATFEALGKLPKESIVTLNIVSGKVKQNKPDDGQFESYFWNVVGIADGQQATNQVAHPPQPSGTPPQKDDAPPTNAWDSADTQARISWGQAVNLAVETLGPLPQVAIGEYERLVATHLYEADRLANLYYPLIRKGPSLQAEPLFPDAPEGPQEAQDDGEEPQGAQPPQQAKPTPVWTWPIRDEGQSESGYFLKVAREKRGLGIGDAYAALGKAPSANGRWTWTLWEQEGHTLQEALDILKNLEKV